MAGVEFAKVTKRFGAVSALDELSLTIPDGEFLVFVGPSGSGKTTALRILAGLETQSSGIVSIGDRVVDQVAPRDRDIAMVFQDYALYPQMSVFQNLAFGLKIRRVAKKEIERRVGHAVAVLGLDGMLDRRPSQLSGGQRQRVALGRALVREPEAFLMDEPLSNLDAKLRAEMRGEIRRLQENSRTTTVYVTHDQIEAMTMGDRVAVMSGGRVEQVADPRTLYEQPANTFVAGFIGSPGMSFVRCGASRSANTIKFRSGVFELTLPSNGEVPAEVVLGIRPEHARLWDTEASLIGPLEGRVEFEEAIGRETLLGLALESGVRLVMVAEGLARTSLGSHVQFGVRPGSVYLFDCQTERFLARA